MILCSHSWILGSVIKPENSHESLFFSFALTCEPRHCPGFQYSHQAAGVLLC